MQKPAVIARAARRLSTPILLACFFWLGRLSLAEIAAFGVGIGAIEASLAIGSRDPLEGTALEGRSKELHTMVEGLGGARGFLFAEVLPAIERWAATGIHVGTRGLTYLTRWTGNPLFLFGALACFVAADGWSYRQLHRGKLATPGGFLRAEIFVLAVALAVLAGFFVAWRQFGG